MEVCCLDCDQCGTEGQAVIQTFKVLLEMSFADLMCWMLQKTEGNICPNWFFKVKILVWSMNDFFLCLFHVTLLRSP